VDIRKPYGHCAAVALLLLGGVFFVCFTQFSPPAMDEASFDRIDVGMSEADVNSLLGGPAGDYTTTDVLQSPVRLLGKDGTTAKQWAGNKGSIVIGFDDGNRVAWKQFIKVVSLDESWVEKCKRWVGF
jgi:hypothetical protein